MGSTGEYRPPKAVVPYRRGTVPDLGCNIRNDPPEKWARNAVYCRADEKIAYDVELIIEEGRQFGILPALLILAHEWGHHIQALINDMRAPSISLELGADCYLGMFAAYVDSKGLFKNELGSATGSLRTSVASAFLSGHTYQQWFDPGVHGTPRERAVAFKEGALTEDVRYCRSYNQYAPVPPMRLGGYLVDVPPGARTSLVDDLVDLRWGPVHATIRAVPNPSSSQPAEAQISRILNRVFEGRAWAPSGGIRDTQPDQTFGGTKAVQPYTAVDGSGPSYGAAMLHLSSGGGILIDVSVPGNLEAAGGEAFQPIGDFMYALLARMCPPETNEVVCTQPLGSRPRA